MLRMRRRTLALACACCAAVTGWAQYQDYSQIGRTPEALRFLDDPLKIELKEPAWLFGGPKMGTPAEQLLLAERLEREGKREEAVEAYDDLVHEWHASPEALTAQLAIARLESAAGRAQQAYDADVYLLAHFAGRFELEPVLADAVAQADALAARERGRTFHLSSGATLRRNYEQIIHFAPRWKRVPELLLRIAELYVEDEEYANAITICDRLVIDWPRYAGLDDAVSVYCRACRLQADVWRNATPDYAPPEMLTRDVPGIDALRHSSAIDVYALCSVLYELYAGKTPYRLAESLSASPYLAKRDRRPVPPALRRPEDAPLVSAILSGIAPVQADRIRSGRLRALLAPYGITTDTEIVVYDTAGVRSAFVTMLLRYAGFTKSQSYDAGFQAWAGNPDLPLVKP